ncbi:hypothetical protein SNK04_014150 [Fusarium graminearum]
MQVDTAPGLPRDEASSAAHQNALASAMRSVLRGEPDRLDMRRIGGLESGFRADATNASSSATGIDQFTAGTWRSIVAQAKPSWARGLNDNELLAARKDPAKSGEMARALDAKNTAALESAGMDATAHNLYAAHHFGEERGGCGPNPMSRILSKAQLDANPYLKGKTKGEAIANWDERARRAGIEAPAVVRMVAAEVAPAGAASVELPPTTPTEAAAIVEQPFQAGPTDPEQVSEYRQEDAALVDVIRRQEQLARENIVPADPRERISREEFDALTARRVEIRQALEKSATATGYDAVGKQLRSRLERIDSDPDLIALADRLSGRDRMREAPRQVLRDSGPRLLSISSAKRRPTGPAHPAGIETPAAAVAGNTEPQAAARAQPVAQESGAELSQQAALEAVAANPDMQVTLDDGTVVTAAEALARADAEIAQAEIDSRGFAAAVTSIGRKLNAAEIQGIEARISRHMRQNSVRDPQAQLARSPDQRLMEAAKEAALELVREAGKKKQRIALTILAHDRVQNHLKQFADKFDGLDRMVAFHADGKGNALSVETRARAIERDALRQMLDTLEATNPNNVVRELHGQKTGDADAAAGAKVFHSITGSLRERFNRSGGDVGQLDDWGMPHHHSQSLVAKAGRAQWIQDTLPLLDRKRYMNEDGSRMTDVEVGEFLGHAWASIATGGINKLEPGRGHCPCGDLWAESDLAFKLFSDKALQEQALLDPNAAGRLEKRALTSENLYNQVAGRTQPVASRWLAETFDTLRSWMTASRLGSAVITSFSDDATMYLSAHVNNLPAMRLFSNELAALNPANKMEKRMALRAGLAMNTLLSSLNRFGNDSLTSSFSNKLAGVTRASGLNALPRRANAPMG